MKFTYIFAMAFIQCKKCDKAFDPKEGLGATGADRAYICPHCGYDNSKENTQELFADTQEIDRIFPKEDQQKENEQVSSQEAVNEQTGKNETTTSQEAQQSQNYTQAVVRIPCEWERDWKQSPFRSYINTVKAIVQSPIEYFRTVKPFEDVFAMLLFVYLSNLVAAFIGYTYQIILGLTLGGFLTQFMPSDFPTEQFMVTSIASLPGMFCGLLIFPFFAIIGMLIGAGIAHLCMMLIGGSEKGFGSTLVVYVLGASMGLWAIIPFFGNIIGAVYGLILLFGGMAKSHEVSGGRTAIAILLPFVLCCCLVGFVFIGLAIIGAVAGN